MSGRRQLWMVMAGGAAALCLGGCAGRASLADNSGVSFDRTFAVQREARPQRPIASLSAADAKIILRNHRAAISTAKGAQGNTTTLTLGGGLAGGGGGLLTPASGDLFGATGEE